MISKELLSAVYPIDETTETYVGIQESTGRVMWFGKEYNDCLSEIDIHRVAHKCKEWAIGEHGLSLHSFPCHDDTYTCEIYKFHKSTGYVIVDWFNCLSENKAIFKACQWILTKDSK